MLLLVNKWWQRFRAGFHSLPLEGLRWHPALLYESQTKSVMRMS